MYTPPHRKLVTMSGTPPAQKSALTAENMARLATFPLGNVVLLPYAVLPLHIFEPRYRQMVEHAVEHQRPIAMSRLAGPSDDDRPAPLHDWVGVGTILRADRLADGRFNLLLRGAGRARVIEEHERIWQYREIAAAWVSDEYRNESECARLQAEIRGVLRSTAQAQPTLAAVFARLAGLDAPPGAYADMVGEVIVRDDQERVSLLEQPVIDRRLEQVLHRALMLLANAHPITEQRGQLN